MRVDDVVLKTLEKEPQLRYQQANDLKTDVDGIKGAVGSGPPTPASVVPPHAAAARPWLPWAIAAAVVMVMFGIAGSAYLMRLPTDGEGTGAVVDDSSISGAGIVLEEASEADRPARSRRVSPPLTVAVARGDLQIVASMLESGADIHATDGLGRTALSLAAAGRHAEIVRTLLDRGAEANVSQQGGITPLMTAGAKGDQAIVQMLLDAGADVKAADIHGKTPLDAAVNMGEAEIVELLLEAESEN